MGDILTRPVTWFVVALVVRLLYMLWEAGSSPLFYVPLLDEQEAVESARALLAGTVPAEPFFKAPGYSWLLAGVLAVSGSAWPWTLRILQHTAGAVVVWLAARLAGKITPAAKGRGISIAAAGALAAGYAPLIRLEENVSLDFWVIFFQSAMLWWLAKVPAQSREFSGHHRQKFAIRAEFVAGLLAAAAWLTRPTITAILPLLAAWILYVHWRRYGRGGLAKAVRPAVLFLLPCLLVAGGVTLRNGLVSGQALTLPWQGGFSFYFANAPGANGRYFLQRTVSNSTESNPTYALSVNTYRHSLSPAAREQFDAKPDFRAVNDYWMTGTLKAITSAPAAWARLMVKKLVYLFSDKEIFNYEDFDLQRSRSPVLRAMPFTFGVVFGLAFAGLAFAGTLPQRRRWIVGLLWFYALGFGGAVALYYVSGRMRMPLAFPMIVLAGCFPAAFYRATRRKRGTATVLLLTGFVLSFGDWWGVRSESMAHADLARMSNAAWQRGRYEQALEFALDAEKLEPDYPALPRLKGQAYYYLGNLQQARLEFEKSVYLLNDDTSIRNLEIVKREMQKRGDE